MLLREVKEVGSFPCLIGWQLLFRGTGFLAETHLVGVPCKTILQRGKKNRKEKDSLWREGKPIQNKDEAVSSGSCWESVGFLPGRALLPTPLLCTSFPAGSQSTMVAHQMLEGLL